LGYIDDNLLEDERIVYKARLHKIIFFYPVLWVMIAMTVWFLIPGDGQLGDTQINLADVRLAVSAIFAAMGLLQGFVVFIKYITSEFAVTDQRLMVKTGLIRRSTFELFLKRLEGIQVDQSITGRILGYGTITASGTGGLQDNFVMISSPLKFRTHIQKCAAEYN
jgi:uncharacterized membrane protein YdbT with pleckstrin-like domain